MTMTSIFENKFQQHGANMLQNTSKTLGFQKIMVYKIPPWRGWGGRKPYLARGLSVQHFYNQLPSVISRNYLNHSTIINITAIFQIYLSILYDPKFSICFGRKNKSFYRTYFSSFFYKRYFIIIFIIILKTMKC